MTDGNAFDRLEQELDFIFYDSRAQCIGQRAEFADVNNHCRNGKAPLFTESDSTGIAITDLGDNLDRRIPSSEVFKEWWEEQMKVIHEQRTNSLFLMQSQDSVEDMETTMRIWRKPDHRNYAVRERVKKCELKKMPPLSDIDRDIIQMELKQPTILPPHLSLAEHFNVSYGNVFTKEKAQSSEPSMNNIKYLHAALHSLASGTHGSSAISLSDLDLKKAGSFGDIQVRRKIGGQTEYWPNTPSHQRNNNIHLATQNSPLEKTLLRNSHVPIDGYKDSTKKNVPLFSPSRMNLTEKEREYLLNRQSSNVNSANAGYATPTSFEDFSRLYNSAKQPDNNMIRRLADNAKDRLIAGATNEKNLGRKRNQFEEGFQHPIFNQVYEQYLQRSNLTNSDSLLYQKACADALLSQNQLQKQEDWKFW